MSAAEAANDDEAQPWRDVDLDDSTIEELRRLLFGSHHPTPTDD